MSKRQSLARRAFRGAAVAALLAVSMLATSAPSQASPIGDVHEGAGYAVAVGPNGTATCTSKAVWVPNATATLIPPTVSISGIAVGKSTCVGNLPISQGVVIEAFTPDGTNYVSNVCPNAEICTVNVPSGWGVFYVMPSSFWDAPPGSTWPVINTVNNDGYCGATAPPESIVCRAWATGVS